MMPNCNCIFVLGRQVNRLAEMDESLRQEAAREKDILQIDMKEHYNNLTIKTIHMIK